MLGFLLWTSAHLRTERQLRLWAVLLGVAALVATALVMALGSPRLISAVISGCSVILIGAVIATIASTLLGRWVVDTATVLGVCASTCCSRSSSPRCTSSPVSSCTRI